jgi:hypothetical protein
VKQDVRDSFPTAAFEFFDKGSPRLLIPWYTHLNAGIDFGYAQKKSDRPRAGFCLTALIQHCPLFMSVKNLVSKITGKTEINSDM